LVELMVALLTGSFVITGAFYMSQVSSRLFSEQLRRSEAQMSIRAATELMRRDLGRAGFLSVRNTDEMLDGADTLGTVGPGIDAVAPQRVTAVSIQRDLNGRQMLIVTGNMSTTEQYFLSSATSMDLVLQTVNESFRRSFVDPTTNAFVAARFMEAFAPLPAAPGPGRMVSLSDLGNGKMFLRNIQSVDNSAVPPTLRLSTPLGINSTGNGQALNVVNVAVAPVSTIRYMMEDPGAHLARVGGRSYLSGRRLDGRTHAVLVRTELDSATLDPILNTAHVVLDSVVDDAAQPGFSVEAVWNNAAPLDMNLVHAAQPENLTAAQQGFIHSVIIQLVLETEHAQGDDLSQRSARAARRALRFEVMLPNAARNAGAMN
jgi:hypothetical protein